MLVSHRHRFIYLKTRKTAGTSVEILLEQHCHGPEPYPGPVHYRPALVTQDGIIGARWRHRPGESNPWPAHIAAAALRNRLGAETWAAYRKFCVVRNPYDQAVSAFWHKCRGELSAGDLPFDGIRARFAAWLRERPAILDNAALILIEGRFALDEVLRYERLEAELADLARRLGLPDTGQRLGSYKAGYRRRAEPWQAYYNRATSRIVERLKAVEFDLFGYERLSL